MVKLDPKWAETPESLFQRSLETNNRRLRERFLALALIASGRSIKQVASQVGRRRQTVAEWVEKYNAQGIDGLQPKFKNKAMTSLSEAQFERLKQALNGCPTTYGMAGTKWRSQDVVVYVRETFGKKIHPETARRYIQKLRGNHK